MEPDTATRYRSRILREMNANRENPFNSPPSSTGSHGTVSPTMSSVFSDPDGESTRRLNEDIARVTAPRKLPINWEAAHRKWPEFYSLPQKSKGPIFDDNTDTKPLSTHPKENKLSKSTSVPVVPKFIDDTTQDAWDGSKRARSEMQPRVDNESDLSSILSKSPARGLSTYGLTRNTSNPSPLSKVHVQSPGVEKGLKERRPSISQALERLRKASASPQHEQRLQINDQSSPNMSSAKSSMTAVPPSPPSVASPDRHNTSIQQSFFMPDVSHLDDFITGTLKFTGSVRNGVPILVKHGKVHDQRSQPFGVRHAEIDGLKIPEEEEKIFVSMDMIREEILSLQDHHDKIQEYAGNLQQEVERLEGQLRSRNSDGHGMDLANDRVLAQKKELEAEVASLQSRLDQATRRISSSEIENDTLTQERDRVIHRLQEACEDISKLTRKLSIKERELETSQRQMVTSENSRQDNDTMRREFVSLQQSSATLEIDNKSLRSEIEVLRREQKQLRDDADSLRSDNNSLRQDHQSLLNENRSLRNNNKILMEENEDLRENLDGVQHALDASREEIESLRQELQTLGEEKNSLREDNDSLVRHNERYFDENKILRRENTGFERSVHELHEKNLALREDIEFLKKQLDHCRPAGKDDLTEKVDDETEENMTSAFFVPDITLKSNETGPVDNTKTNDMPELPELTSHTNMTNGINELEHGVPPTETKQDFTTQSEKPESRQRSRSGSKNSKSASHGQKVAFALPENATEGEKGHSAVANQGSKRRSIAKPSIRDIDPFDDLDDTTGMLSIDNLTQDLALSLNLTSASNKDMTGRETKENRTQDIAKPAPAPQHVRSKSQALKRVSVSNQTAINSIKPVDKDTCPVLSSNARRVLDSLSAHSCKNCIVCSRITSHHGVITSADISAGKKRVSVPRPVPVSDREVAGEDPTVRPAQSPGHALALVIKGLEDESQHLQLELTRLQAQYNASDKSLGRRERLTLAEAIRMLLRRLETKNDQIYSLYDVLEGQKAANQAMTEEEVELTVLNITGMTVRDVTSASDQLTWEGIMDV